MLYWRAMQREQAAAWVLALALGGIFLYFGVDKFLHPLLWIGWIPPWMDGMLGQPKEFWLQVIGGVEIASGALVLAPVMMLRRAGAALMAGQLFGIVTQVGFNDIGARDAGLLAASVALFLLL